MHKLCMEDIFTVNKNECNGCQATIALGFETCLNAPKVSLKRAAPQAPKLDAANNLSNALKR